MPTLRSSLSDLTTSFADSVLAAIRTASLDELLAEAGGAGSVGDGGGRARGGTTANNPKFKSLLRSESDRLPRRSADDIATALVQVVALVKKSKEGLRAEQIRSALGMQPKEMPRILKEGLATKKLKTKGQKRATTYFAA